MEDDPEISIICKDLIHKLLESDTTKRLKIDEVLKHPFVSATDKDYQDYLNELQDLANEKINIEKAIEV